MIIDMLRARRFFAIFFLLFFSGATLHGQFFTRISTPASSDATYSTGCSWGDYNNDGYPDLFVCNTAGNNLLYRNNGIGGFTRITSGAIVNDGGTTNAAVWGDYNNDGYLDLYVSNRGSSFPITAPAQQNFLYKNDGPPNYTFTKITTQPPANDANYTWSSSWVDYNNDGWLDLHVPENLHSADDYFYENDGSGNFSAISLPFILPDGDDPSTGVGSWIDFDNDGDQDVLLAKSGRFLSGGAEDNRLFQSQLSETGSAASFNEVTTGGLVTHFDRDFQASWGDYDNDGDMDVLTGNFDGPNYLYRNDGGSTFTRITGQAIVTDPANTLGSTWGDYDNDGDIDLFVSNTAGFPARVFRNEGNGNFSQMTFSDLGNITTNARGSNSCALADYDNDGDLDLYISNASTPTGAPQNNDLYRNDQGNNNNWLHIDCIGTTSNRSAIGASIRLKASIFGQQTWQMRAITGSPTGDRGQNDQRVHFGLGDASVVDTLVINWPSGNEETYTNVSANQFITVTENSGITGLSENEDLPSGFLLKQNYPNPFNPSTTIAYFLPASAAITLTVYNMLGQRIRTLIRNEKQAGGEYRVQWNGRDDRGQQVVSGVYFYRLEMGSFQQSRKMLFLR